MKAQLSGLKVESLRRSARVIHPKITNATPWLPVQVYVIYRR
jgi:hypothetical protein